MENRLKNFCKKCAQAKVGEILEHSEDDVVIKVEVENLGYKVWFMEGDSKVVVLETYCANNSFLRYEILEYFGFEAY